MFSIMTLLFVVAIILWCFSTQARAQAQLETARPTVKQAIGKITTRREATGKPAPVAGGSCDFGVVVTTGDEFTVLTIGLTVFQNKTMVVPIPGWGAQRSDLRADSRRDPCRRVRSENPLQPSEISSPR
ncbi:hypothetical protein [Bradyrhizobium diazoefficiens]